NNVATTSSPKIKKTSVLKIFHRLRRKNYRETNPLKHCRQWQQDALLEIQLHHWEVILKWFSHEKLGLHTTKTQETIFCSFLVGTKCKNLIKVEAIWKIKPCLNVGVRPQPYLYSILLQCRCSRCFIFS
ncbi:hypothetical protein ACJX0J_041058, partial [Zea mays]